MRRYSRRRYKSPKTQVLDVKGWPRGLNTLVNPNMIRVDELAEAINAIFTQYGVISKRPGTSLVVNLDSHEIQGYGVYNRREDDDSLTRYLCAVAGGNFYVIDPVAKTKTLKSGHTFHTTNRVKMVQGGNKLYIFDGHSAQVSWDGTTFYTPTEIDPPENLSITKEGSGTGTKTVSYVVTAANGQETNGSSAVQLTSCPNQWDTDTYAKLDWDDVDGADSYNIYRGSPGNETYLTSVTESRFFDQGQADASQSFLVIVPDENRTGGIVFSTGTIYHESIVAVEKANRNRIWISAGGDKIDSFAPGDGGTFYDYHTETGEAVNGVEVYAGLGEDFVYIFQDHKVGQLGFAANGAPQVKDVNLAVGAASDASIVLFENDLGFWSRYGGYTLRMEPNLVNVLRIAELTVRVHPTYVNSISQQALSKVCGVYDKANHVIIWSIPSGATQNNTSLAYDPVYVGFSEYRGIAATAFIKFVDANNNEHTYGGDSQGNVFKLFDGTSDMGDPIYFRVATKLFDMDAPYAYKTFERLYLLFGNIQAQNLKVQLIKDGLEELKTFSVASQQGQTGWGADLWGDVLWGDSSGTLVSANNRSVMRFVDIYQDLFNLQIVYENKSATDTFEILGLYVQWQASQQPPPSEMRVE